MVDRWGSLVSVTASGGWLQSSPTNLGLGFALSARADVLAHAGPAQLTYSWSAPAHDVDAQHCPARGVGRAAVAPSSFAPRTSQPGRLVVEESFPQATINELCRRGHDLEIVPPHNLGGVPAAIRELGGMIRAAASPASCQAYAIIR